MCYTELHEDFISGCGPQFKETVNGAAARLFLWEVSPMFKCPLAGLCLSPPEQRRLIKKTTAARESTPFETHKALVQALEKENVLSRAMDKRLKRKYFTSAYALFRLDDAAFLEKWNQRFESGAYQALFWAAATHPFLSDATRERVFGDVHMAMHAAVEKHLELCRVTARLTSELELKSLALASWKQKCVQARRECAAACAARDRHARDANNAAAELAKARQQETDKADLFRLAALDNEARGLRAGLEDMACRYAAQGRELAEARAQCGTLRQELERREQTHEALIQEMQAAFHFFVNSSQCDEGCPSFSICKKRVLIVGGINRMECLYRRIIEERGGFLEYHTGHMRKGVKRLEESLRRADIVLCPVCCNSHGACSLVKQLGKKHKKPVHLLSNFSLSAITKVLGGRHDASAAGPQ